MVNGSEEGWANASHDSRRADKQRDIKATIDKMAESQKRRQAEWESKLEDEMTAATMEAVLKGGGDRSILHGGARFRYNFDNWLKSLER